MTMKILYTLMLFVCLYEQLVAQMPLQSSNVNYETFYKLYKENIELSIANVYVSESGKAISKREFLEFLISKKYYPIKNAKGNYKLIKYAIGTQNDILEFVKKDALFEKYNYGLVHKKFPMQSFTNIYDKPVLLNTSGKGKYTLIKCWYIQCKPCVAEIPRLNLLVKKHHNDFDFIALTFDGKDDLKEFIAKKNFDYEIIPSLENFVLYTLNMKMFPTHIVVDSFGKVAYVGNTIDNLLLFLNKNKITKDIIAIPDPDSSKTKLIGAGLPPPPPPPPPFLK